jgi:hypothetical protein
LPPPSRTATPRSSAASESAACTIGTSGAEPPEDRSLGSVLAVPSTGLVYDDRPRRHDSEPALVPNATLLNPVSSLERSGPRARTPKALVEPFGLGFGDAQDSTSFPRYSQREVPPPLHWTEGVCRPTAKGMSEHGYSRAFQGGHPRLTPPPSVVTALAGSRAAGGVG